MLPSQLPELPIQSSGLAQESKPASGQHGVLLAALVMAIIGWGGLIQLVATTRPRIGGELWLFFLLLQFAITGTALPILRFFSLRFISVNDEPLPLAPVVRRSIWAGILVVASAWLMIPRIFSPAYVLVLALILLVIETFLRNRELAHGR